MSLAPGVRLGPYTIEALLGAGGMGEVYRARDCGSSAWSPSSCCPRPSRAIPGGLRRSPRGSEAARCVDFNHPHIAHVYGFEQASSPSGQAMHVLAMELVEGEDLACRLERRPIAQGEALAVARQIAEALDAAHEKGIVHRDLAPANVMLTLDGGVRSSTSGWRRPARPTDRPQRPPARSRRRFRRRSHGRERSSARRPTCPAQRAASPWARGPTSGHSAACCSRCSRVVDPSRGTRPPTRSRRSCRPTLAGTCCPRRLRSGCADCCADASKDASRRLRDIGDRSRTSTIRRRPRGHARARPHSPAAAAPPPAGARSHAAARGMHSPWHGGVSAPPVGRAPDPPHHDRAAARPELSSGNAASCPWRSSSDGRRLRLRRPSRRRHPALAKGAQQPRVEAARRNGGATHPFFSPDGEWIGYFAGGALQKVAASAERRHRSAP